MVQNLFKIPVIIGESDVHHRTNLHLAITRYRPVLGTVHSKDSWGGGVSAEMFKDSKNDAPLPSSLHTVKIGTKAFKFHFRYFVQDQRICRTKVKKGLYQPD